MNKKEAILISAVTLLAEKGVHKTPMSAIAKAANTGMGTIYNYFPNKEALINEIYLSIKRKEKNVFDTFDPKQPIKTQFEAYVSAIIEFFLNNKPFFQFMEQLQASPMITDESRAEGLKSMDSVLELLAKGKEERIIKTINIDELLLFIGGAVLSYLRWHFSQKKDNRLSLNNQKQMIWDAIKE